MRVVNAWLVGIDGEHNVGEVAERVRETVIRKAITNPATLGLRDDQPTAAQATQVVARVRSGEAETKSQFARIGRAVEHREEQLTAGGISQRPTKASEAFEPNA